MKRLLVLLTAILVAAACHHYRRPPETTLPAEAPAPLPAEETEPAAMTVGGREVPVWLYRYWLGEACRQAEEQYAGTGQAPDWNGPLRQQVRDRAMADAALCAVVDDWADAWGCALTEADRNQLELLWADRAAAHGGEEAYLRSLAQRGLDRAQAMALAEVGQQYRKLHLEARRAGSPHAPTPEQLSAQAEAGQQLWINCITVTGEDAQSRIAALFSRLNGAHDPLAAFAALAREGEDHRGVRPVTPGDGQLTPALEEAARALRPGCHSGILAAGSGYTVLLRTAPDLAVLTEQWLDDRLLRAAAAAPQKVLPALATVPIPVQPYPHQ